MTKDKSAPTEPSQDVTEITEDELETVNGGVIQGTTVSRVKSADKQQKALNDFIRG